MSLGESGVSIGGVRILRVIFCCSAIGFLGKSSKYILPNGGLMVTYNGTIRKKSPRKTHPRYLWLARISLSYTPLYVHIYIYMVEIIPNDYLPIVPWVYVVT